MEGDAVRVGPVLEETFYILSKKNTVYRVKLTEKGLSLQKESNGNTKTETIRINDIVGCRCMRSKRKTGASCVCHPSAIRRNGLRVVEENSGEQDESDISAYLYIYAYVLKKYKVKGQRRERMTITLRFRSFDKYDDNMREAQKWRIAVKCLIRNKPVPRCILLAGETDLVPGLEAVRWCPASRSSVGEEKKILVLLNPKSGPGKAREMFQQRVVPALAEAEVAFDLYVTKHANYARDFMRTKDIYQWRGVVVVGGDGIVFEVFNGMFERPDWERAVKELPVGVIPCGSGNGLAKTIAYAIEEPYDQNPILISTLNIIKCRSMPMDLVRVETKTQILFSFLSVGWGLLSDIDIESERLRAIGGQRFTVWSVARLIGLRTYRGKLWYLPLDGYKSQQGLNPSAGILTRSTSHCPNLDGKGEETTFPSAASLTPVHSSLSFHDCIGQEGESVITESLSLETALGQALEDLDVESIDGNSSGHRPRLDSYYSATSRRSTYFSTAGSSYQSLVDSASLAGSSEVEPRSMNSSVRVYGPPSQLPSLTQPVPAHWKAIDGDFVMVHASYQTHLGSDCLFAPNSKLADGIIWLLVIRAGITRAQLLQFLLGLSSGSHLTCPRAEMIPVTAFRLEPETGMGHMTVDGELVDYGPIQAELIPSLAHVMSR